MNNETLDHLKAAVNKRSACLAVVTNQSSVYDMLLVMALFDNSRKCPLDEGFERLQSNTAESIVNDNRPDFERHFREKFGSVHWIAKDYKKLALLVEADIARLKHRIVATLRAFLPDLVAEVAALGYPARYRTTVNGVTYEEHSMTTLVDCLNFVNEAADKLPIGSWFALKSRLVAFIRVGNAVTVRSEWTGRVIAP